MLTATGDPVTVTLACSQKHVPERTISCSPELMTTDPKDERARIRDAVRVRRTRYGVTDVPV